jgi:arylsulfatase A-like enzyme
MSALSGCGAERIAKPNVILITLDTTRADRMGLYGYERDTTPRLDAFAEESLVFERAISPSSWTLPAHASLFTGKFTTSHGARYDPEGPLHLAAAFDGRAEFKGFRARGLAGGQQTLAQLLSDAGYTTGAVVAGPWLKKGMGLDAGFDHHDDSGIHSERGRIAPDVTDAALEWLSSGVESPFFLFLNYFDPHGPYRPPVDFFAPFLPKTPNPIPKQREIEESGAFYDGELRFMDHHVGRLFDGLRNLGLYDDAWIIVTADHGELLGERGLFGHGKSLDQALVHIPMIVKYPAGEVSPGRSRARVQLVDVLPTLVLRLGLPLPPDVQGTPFGSGGHPVVAEVYPLEILEGSNGDVRAYYEGDLKFMWRESGNHTLIDLANDPREERSIGWQRPEQSAAMQRALDEYLASLPAPPEVDGAIELDPETQEALRGLGYLE